MIYGREFTLPISYTKYSFVYNVSQLTRTMCSYSIHSHIRNRCLFDIHVSEAACLNIVFKHCSYFSKNTSPSKLQTYHILHEYFIHFYLTTKIPFYLSS